MSREIRFRAWDTKYGHMVQYEDMLLYDHQVLSSFVMPLRGDYEFMQYTGLKDKNGVEIYEGDVVSYCGYNQPVEFMYGCFCTRPAYRLRISKGRSTVVPLMGMTTNRLQVIGNIYENPELLKAKGAA